MCILGQCPKIPSDSFCGGDFVKNRITSKRLTALLLGAVLVCAAFAGCGGKTDSDAPQSSAEATASAKGSAATAPTANSAAGSTASDSSEKQQSGKSASSQQEPKAHPLRAVVEECVGNYAYSGVAYVTQDGAEVYSAGDLNAVYRVCSVSKQFTAAAILMLQEEGKLNIGSTIDNYFPEYSHGGEITIAQLMNMCSGIPDYISLAADGSLYANAGSVGVSPQNTSEQNRSALKQWIFAQDLLFAPGSKGYYCNSNYLLLAEIINQVSGKPYETFITERMLAPAGMTSTGFGDTYTGAVTGDGEAGSEWFAYKGVCYGCGDMVSTAADLEKWGHEWIDNKVLSDSVVSQMTTDYLDGYGYGIVPDNGSGYVYHDGNLPPYISTLCVSRERRLVLVMLDRDYSSPLMSLRESICAQIG